MVWDTPTYFPTIPKTASDGGDEVENDQYILSFPIGLSNVTDSAIADLSSLCDAELQTFGDPDPVAEMGHLLVEMASRLR
jgi:hypothetical protein